MIPTPQALAAMAAVVCPQDGGDPFGWGGVSELTPEGASRGAVRALSAPRPVRGPSGQWTAEIASDGRTGLRTVEAGLPEIGHGDDERFDGYLTGTAGTAPTPVPPSRPLAAPRSAELPPGGEPELGGAERQSGAQGRGAGNGATS